MRLATSFRRDARHVSGASLTEDQLRVSVPSIFADAPHESRSARYTQIPTVDVVRGLGREGFNPVFACEARARDESKHGYVKHMVRFRRQEPEGAHGAVPEVVMVNSHDGSTSYQLFAGMFRFICTNGMVCGDTFGEVRVHHKGDIVRDVIEGAFRVVDTFDRVRSSVDQFRAITMKPDEREALAHGALHLKYWDEEAQELQSPIQSQQLLIPRRFEDKATDMWTTFNTVQENLIRGGVRGLTTDANGRRKRTTTRAVNGIDGNVKLNRALWTITERMAGLLSKAA